jgi:hypothetical protein
MAVQLACRGNWTFYGKSLVSVSGPLASIITGRRFGAQIFSARREAEFFNRIGRELQATRETRPPAQCR